MRRFFNTLKELILEKKFIILILGGVLGLFSFFIILILEDLDLQVIEGLLGSFPPELLDFFGGIAVLGSPYGFWALELLTFIWLYAGIYIVFMASSLL